MIRNKKEWVIMGKMNNSHGEDFMYLLCVDSCIYLVYLSLLLLLVVVVLSLLLFIWKDIGLSSTN